MHLLKHFFPIRGTLLPALAILICCVFESHAAPHAKEQFVYDNNPDLGTDATGNQTIAADHSAFRYTGRIDISDPATPKMFYSSSSIETRFTGTSCQITVSDKGGWSESGNKLYVEVNGNGSRYQLDKKTDNQVLTVASGLNDGTHDLLIVNEFGPGAGKGAVVFHGLTLDAGATVHAASPAPEGAISFYGNSTCEGAPGDLVGGSRSYPMVTGELLNAQVHNNGIGGLAVMDNTGFFQMNGTTTTGFESTWDQLNPSRSVADPWDFSRFSPQVVVLSLGINDQSSGTAFKELARWKSTFSSIIRSLDSKHNGTAEILLFPLTTTWTGEALRNVRAVYDELKNEGMTNLHFFTNTQIYPTANNDNTHPNEAGAIQLAQELASYISDNELLNVQTPQAVFTVSTTNGPSPLEVTFDASGSHGENLSYAWDLGDGTTQSGMQVAHTYTDTGLFTVTLSVTEGDSTVSATRVIEVYDPANIKRIRNGNFSAGSDHWNWYTFEGAGGSADMSSGAAEITVTSSGTDIWHVQLNQGNLIVNDGEDLLLTFDAKATTGRSMNVTIKHFDPETKYLDQTVNLTTTIQSFSYPVAITSSPAGPVRIEFNFGGQSGDVTLDNIILDKNLSTSVKPSVTVNGPELRIHPSHREILITGLVPGRAWNASLFDLSGRLVTHQSGTSATARFAGRAVCRGRVYVLRLEQEKLNLIRRVQITR